MYEGAGFDVTITTVVPDRLVAVQTKQRATESFQSFAFLAPVRRKIGRHSRPFIRVSIGEKGIKRRPCAPEGRRLMCTRYVCIYIQILPIGAGGSTRGLRTVDGRIDSYPHPTPGLRFRVNGRLVGW